MSQPDSNPATGPDQELAREGEIPEGPQSPDGEVAAASAGDDSFSGDSAPLIVDRALAEQRDRYLRLAAEYDNYRKRTAKERLEAEARGQSSLVKQLLDPLDDLSRFAHVDPASADLATIVQGIEMVAKKLQKVLNGMGLAVIDPGGETVDPTLHEAVATEPALSAGEDHMVARVYQQGYMFNGQLLRPARVVVKQWNG
jgi:molecular chaperone GrpE